MRNFWLKRATIFGALVATASSFLFAPAVLAVPPGHRIGSDDAPVFLEVWADYSDDSNVELQNVISKVMDIYGSQVQLILKPFPVRGGSGSDAFQAAEAGECVAAQGEDLFWHFHDFMLGRRGVFTQDDIWQWGQGFQAYSYVQKRAIPIPRFSLTDFTHCWKSHEKQWLVDWYVSDGYRKDVESAPTVLVVSRTMYEVMRFDGYVPGYGELIAAIDATLGNIKMPPMDAK